jgi:hypothetical protein
MPLFGPGEDLAELPETINCGTGEFLWLFLGGTFGLDTVRKIVPLGLFTGLVTPNVKARGLVSLSGCPFPFGNLRDSLI